MDFPAGSDYWRVNDLIEVHHFHARHLSTTINPKKGAYFAILPHIINNYWILFHVKSNPYQTSHPYPYQLYISDQTPRFYICGFPSTYPLSSVRLQRKDCSPWHLIGRKRDHPGPLVHHHFVDSPWVWNPYCKGYWLVVILTILKNDGVRQSVGMMKFPTYGNIKHVPNHQSG